MSWARTAPLRLTAPTRLTVGVAAVRQDPGSSCHGVLIKALCPGEVIYLGASAAVTTATGWPLADGDVLDIQVKQTSDLWFIASAGGQTIALLPYAL